QGTFSPVSQLPGARLAGTFEGWGYDPVATPTFEYADVVALGAGVDDGRLFRLFDREGNTLALRPEMTTAIARLAATRLGAQARPLRLFYLANVFRYDEPQQGRDREFSQAGAELIGDAAPTADAEIVALAVAALADAGLRDYRLDIGHHGFFHGLMQDLGVDEPLQNELHDALLERNLVAYAGLCAAVPQAGRERLLAVPDLMGDQSLFAAAQRVVAGPRSQAALDNLRAVYAATAAAGDADKVRLDLSMVKALGYYTGMVLEGYAPGIGFTLCSGGRYDGLVQRFGRNDPAVGVSLGVERLMLALARQGALPDAAPAAPVLVDADASRRPEARALVQRWREAGLRVIAAGQHSDEASLRAAARRLGATAAYLGAEAGRVRLWTGAAGAASGFETVAAESLPARLGAKP
ncbi:MAG TPA: ATP phosphoribosyltransferase regulatory subunit, partial [Limnochordia bacterium]|nr:ATP phosphoribosyltransferase regulatory subunit [Limnochordia bacterium]